MTLTSLRCFVAVAGLAGLCACGPYDGGLHTPIVVDGEFDEWASLPTVLSDPSDVPNGAAVDLGDVQAHSDGRFLYLTLETGGVVNAQAMRGTISIVIDADGDPRTGETLGDMEGAELVLELSRQNQVGVTGRSDDSFGAGIGIRTLDGDGKLGAPANAGDLDVIVSPTFAANRFEIRLRRGMSTADRAAAMLAGDAASVQVVYQVDGDTVDRTEVADIDLAPLGDGDAAELWTEPIGRGDGDVRVVVWNVASESFRDRAERFARVLGGLDPDVLLLDEVFGEVTAEDIEGFLALPALRSRGDWEYVLGRSGGRQKTVVASRIGIRAEPTLMDLPYPAEALAALEKAFPDPRAQRLFALERQRGLASVGAWVDVAGLPVLFAPIDLQSAGYAGSFEDELRKLQATTLRDMVADALSRAGGSAATVIGGDLNLVGSREPLDILVRGLDRGGVDLVPADARRLTDGSYATWRNHRTPFTPGRLDFVLVPMQTLEVTRAFAFDATELSDELRDGLGIAPDDATMTSDHLPVVVDLTLRRDTP